MCRRASDGAIRLASARSDCAGTTARMASAFSASASEDVMAIFLSMAMPGNSGLARVAAMVSAALASRDHKHDIASRAQRRMRQRRSPASGSEHRDPFEGHG